jgi:hypothetical protein
VSRQPQTTSPSLRCVPSAVRALDGLPAESASALERWLDALAELPLDRWLAVGQACTRDVAGRQRRVTSTALLEAIVSDQRIELAAWFIGDLVQTAAYPATRAAARARRSTQRDFAVARSAAGWAALAIATRTWLPRADHDALCAPFDAVLSNGSLRFV